MKVPGPNAIIVLLSVTFVAGGLTGIIATWVSPTNQCEVHSVPEPVSCPHSDSILTMQRKVAAVEKGLASKSVARSEAVAAMSEEIAKALVDVACLYRWHVLQTYYGPSARAVRDKPVPGSWINGRLSSLWPPTLTMADCAQRMAP